MKQKNMQFRRTSSVQIASLLIVLFAFMQSAHITSAQLSSTNYVVSGAALTGPSGTLGAPYGGGAIPGQYGATSNSTNYALNSISTFPSLITHDLPPLNTAAGIQYVSGGGYVPDRLSVQSPLGLLGQESGVLRYDLKDGKIVQLDLQKYSFQNSIKANIVEKELLYANRPLSTSPVTLLGKSSFQVTFKDATGKDVDPQKPFQLTIFQAPGKPMPSNAAVYYFDDVKKIWVKIEWSIVKNNYITFNASRGKEYALFAGTTGPSLLATDTKTILDVNNDGKVNSGDRDIIVPEYRTVVVNENQPIPRPFVPGIVKGVTSERDLEDKIEQNWKEVADKQSAAKQSPEDPSLAYEAPVTQTPPTDQQPSSSATTSNEATTIAQTAEESQSSNLPMILGIIGVVILLALGALFPFLRKKRSNKK